MATDQKLDERALEMRTAGNGFVTIAGALGLGKASEANSAFNRALRRLPEAEQATVRDQEQHRLDRLAASTKANEALSKEVVDRRLATIERLRTLLLAD